MDLSLRFKIAWDIENLSAGVDEKVDNFNVLFLTCLDQHVPVKSVKLEHKSHPCVNGEIKQRIIAKNKSHRKARRSKSPHDDWSAFKPLRQEINYLIRTAEAVQRFSNDINVKQGTSALIWKVIRKAISK